MRALLAVALVAVAGCPAGTEPRPFGLETHQVTLSRGGAAHVGFRVARHDAGGGPSFSVTPEGKGLQLDVFSFVLEADAWAGIATVSASAQVEPGEYTAVLAGETLQVTVAPPPAVTLDPKTMRRSTVAKSAPGLTAALSDDGTVWQTVGDGGVSRVESLSGVRAISMFGPGSVVAVTLEGKAVDVRATQAESLTLQSDGTVANTTLTNLAAVRPYFVVLPGNVMASQDSFLSTDGTLLAGTEQGAAPVDPRVTGVVDVIPTAKAWLTADGTVFAQQQTSPFRVVPVFQREGLRALEGDGYQTFSGQTAEYRHHALWVADGLAWFQPSEMPLRVLTLPGGGEVRDVFVRDRWWFLLGADGRLFEGDKLLPFPSVRPAAPAPDVGVFCDPIPFTPGGTVQVALRVARDGFDGALTLTPRSLPSDVTVPAVSIPAGATTATLPVAFASSGVVRPFDLEFALVGEGLTRTTLLPVELPRGPRRVTVASDLVLKRDGTVWRLPLAGPPTQVMGLSNIVSITSNMALDADGAVFSFGQNQRGELGRGTYGVADQVPGRVTGVPKAVAIAFSNGAGSLTSLVLDEQGQVWRFGSTSTTDPGTVTPTLVAGLPRMVDVNGDASPAALDASGAVWLVNRPKQFMNAPVNRIGLVLDGAPATVDQSYGVPGSGRLNQTVKVLWYTGFATLTDGRGVWSLATGAGLSLMAFLPGSEGAVYASREGVVVKADGTVWRRPTNGPALQQVAGISDVAIPR
ncbi:MAG: hypothetical protein GQE15_19355 [Archangiaceae bacterium]|nr:hypothetical protein [Archangiaceae bacterium]